LKNSKFSLERLYTIKILVQTIKKIKLGAIHVRKAMIGNVIEFRDGLRGIVEKVNENSVIVDLTYMDNYRDLELDERTVVNHKNYRIIKESIHS